MSTVTVDKLTGVELLRESAGLTTGKESHLSLKSAYKSEHSPSRTQWFFIRIEDVPTKVSVHLVRHHSGGQTPFVKTGRADRGGSDEANRLSPVDHGLMINAQSLIDMAKVRLCYQAEPPTRATMEAIKDAVGAVDPELRLFLVPKCIYRNGLCGEPKPCGRLGKIMEEYSYYQELFILV